MAKILYIGIVVLVLVITGIVFVSVNLNSGNNTKNYNNIQSKAIDSESNTDIREIMIDVKRFEFIPETIKVKQGEIIRIKINNLDTTHGIRIPELGVSGNDVIEFTADKKGTFTFYCNNYCGKNHPNMKGKIIVK